ncbi:hypothetical protein [Clostridium sp. BJN0001]|uniref:hypothetical protein n=1 Tax=Clostridium sp. BJN0001 TaxID=2930219 RepID=UPI001FD2C929|nr:hypothetical protein [Clostridium sp. BJN0001]
MKKGRGLYCKKYLEEAKINNKNKKLIMDRMNSYSVIIKNGIERYEEARKKFIAMVILSFLLYKIYYLAIPLILTAIIFLLISFSNIRFYRMNCIIDKISYDISFKGIFDRNKIDDMLYEFKNQYPCKSIEYKELLKTISMIEKFITKIEELLKNNTKGKININKIRNDDKRILCCVNNGKIMYFDKAVEFFDGSKKQVVKLKDSKNENNLTIYLYRKKA